MQQRYYDPIAGRFLSVDPVVTDANTGKGFGLYTYVDNNPYAKIDPDGRDAVVTEKKDGSIAITIPIKFSGPGATPENIANITKDIQSTWSGTHNVDGKSVNVSVAVTGDKTDGKLNNVTLTTGPTSNTAAQGASFVSGGNSGEWNVNSAGMKSGEAAHEAGHLMGSKDQYSSGTDASGNRTTAPNKGYEGNLMAQFPGKPDGRNIKEVLTSPANVQKKE